MYKKGIGMKSNSAQLVSEVNSVDARWVAMNKVSIIVNAVGKTTTNGWKNAQLVPVVYVQPPPDKVWDFSFVAEKPDAANDVITEISASYQWNNAPGDVKAVRVLAQHNQKVSNVK
jgi:hypothetical protein